VLARRHSCACGKPRSDRARLAGPLMLACDSYGATEPAATARSIRRAYMRSRGERTRLRLTTKVDHAATAKLPSGMTLAPLSMQARLQS